MFRWYTNSTDTIVILYVLFNRILLIQYIVTIFSFLKVSFVNNKHCHLLLYSSSLHHWLLHLKMDTLKLCHFFCKIVQILIPLMRLVLIYSNNTAVMYICIHCTCRCICIHVNSMYVICHVIMFIFLNGILKFSDIITSLWANKIFYMMYYVMWLVQ